MGDHLLLYRSLYALFLLLTVCCSKKKMIRTSLEAPLRRQGTPLRKRRHSFYRLKNLIKKTRRDVRSSFPRVTAEVPDLENQLPAPDKGPTCQCRSRCVRCQLLIGFLLVGLT